jgi:hypothetical protein
MLGTQVVELMCAPPMIAQCFTVRDRYMEPFMYIRCTESNLTGSKSPTSTPKNIGLSAT